MRENRLKRLWQDGQKANNAWLQIPSGWTAETFAHAGFDSVTIDLQHGMIDYAMAVIMLQAISTSNAVPLARLAWNDPAVIMQLLDAGVYGLICPMINNRAEAEAFVSACRYPPLGMRSFGPARALLYAGDDYLEHANETVLALAMIETAAALENVDDIAAVPGLDGVYIGPSDLSLSLGLKQRADFADPALLAAFDRILEAAARHDRVVGIYAGSPERAAMLGGRGFHLVSIANDMSILAAGALRAANVQRPASSRY